MAIPHLGATISLISKSEIRYEGTLYSIDRQASTVSLQNVQSFGSEGRKREGSQIPAANEIYDYIIFRGSDIKELHVVELPVLPPSHDVASNDPAILNNPNRTAIPPSRLPTYGVPPSYPPPVYPPFGGPVPGAVTNSGVFFPTPTLTPAPPSVAENSFQQQQQKPVSESLKADTPFFKPAPYDPLHQQKSQPMKISVEQPLNKDEDSFKKGEDSMPDPDVPPGFSHMVSQHGKNGTTFTATSTPLSNGPMMNSNAININRQSGRPSHLDTFSPLNPYHHLSAINRFNERPSHLNTSFPLSSFHHLRDGPPTVRQPMGDFDFEESNAKFRRGVEEEESETTTTPDRDDHPRPEPPIKRPSSVPKAYDKSKSFFDNISCETLDKADVELHRAQLQTYRRVRKTIDMQTFGELLQRFDPYGPANGNRGGARGFRGGGGAANDFRPPNYN